MILIKKKQILINAKQNSLTNEHVHGMNTDKAYITYFFIRTNYIRT